ncbi:MAG: hypothetical protein IBJ11_02175 [Phycisphaerales bacterium]|nr:hypothetical protein [Phycisphaerales bacterium]
MRQIDHLLRRGAWRLFGVRWVHASIVSLAAAGAGLAVVRVAERIVAFPFNLWLTLAVTVGVAVVGAGAWALLTRPDRLGVARALDSAAGLKESLSTAVCVGRDDGAWGEAALAHAESVSRTVRVARALPWRGSRVWPVAPAGLAAFLLLGLVPTADLLNKQAARKAADEDKVQIVQARTEAQQAKKALDEALGAVKDDKLAEHLGDLATADAAKSPEEIRREAVKRLTAADERLSELMQGDKSRALQQIEEKMRELRQPPAGSPQDLQNMVQAMQKGDFRQAAEAAKKLAEQMQSQAATPEQRQQIQTQLQRLAEQMESLARDRKALEEALKQAGIDQKLAADPQAAQRAIDDAKNLTPEQKKSLQELAQASEAASQAFQEAAKAAGQAGQPGAKAAEAMQSLGEKLSALEAMQDEINSMRAAQGKLRDQLNQIGKSMGQSDSGSAMADLMRQSGRGSGQNRGQGGGQGPAPKETAVNLNARKAGGGTDERAAIIGSTVIQGDQVRGEAAAEFGRAVQAGSAAATEAIDSKIVPREYHDAIKHYFGQLREKAAQSTPRAPEKPGERK